MLTTRPSRLKLRRLSLMALFGATLAACGGGDDEVANLTPPASTPAPTAGPTPAPTPGTTPAPGPTATPAIPPATPPTAPPANPPTAPPATTPATPPASAVTAGDCVYNPQLLSPGTTYQQDLVFGQGSQSTETQSRFAVLGTGNFNGVTAVETQLDTTLLNAALPTLASVTARSYIYSNIAGSDYVNYGLKTTATSNTGGITTTVTSTSVNTPPIRTPITARVGDTFSQTYAVRTTAVYSFSGVTGVPIPAPTITDRTETQVWKFVAVETTTVAAGTFQTCRLETTSTSTQNGTSSTTTATGWVVASGPVRGLLAKVGDASGQILEAKVLRVN
jgi:hypothetical protein